jgi:acetyl esterase/lipase
MIIRIYVDGDTTPTAELAGSSGRLKLDTTAIPDGVHRLRIETVDGDRIGVWGFSAGGHLASSAATHFDSGKPDAEDPIDRVSCPPDFTILAYPVISMDPSVSHGGTRKNLLGNNPDPALVELMSNDNQVTKETPPTFIFHTDDDTAVPVANSLLYYLACKKHGVSVEMHSYAHGTHGVGLALKDAILRTWPERLEAWLASRGLLKK